MAGLGIGELLTALAAGASLVGTAVSAVGSIAAGNQEAAADKTNAAIQQQNAEIATAQAQSQAEIDKRQNERQLGEIASSYGASGVAADVGSPLDVMADQAATGELTRQLDLYRGVVQASGNLTQASLLQQQAQAARQGALYRAGGTILTGLGQTARNVTPLLTAPAAPAAAPAAATVPTLPTNPLAF